MKRLSILILCLFLITLTIGFAKDKDKENGASLISTTTDETILKFEVKSFSFEKVKGLKGSQEIVAKHTSKILKKGSPDVSRMSAAIIIPDDGNMKIEVTDVVFKDHNNVTLAPSKGVLSRKINPDTIPFKNGEDFNTDAFFPGTLAELGKPYIIRDYRGQAVLVNPFQYNPVTKVLRVYTQMTVKIYNTGAKAENALTQSNSRFPMDPDFKNVYADHFINYQPELQYTSLNDTFGRMLIVCYNGFTSTMSSFVSWKQSIGYTVDLVDYSTIGSSAALKTYVANYYNTNGLTYLLLVGDHAQVPTSSTSAGDSDNNYGYIVGSDSYLDIFVGRFSAETTAQLQTQIDRTIWYERDLLSTAAYFKNAVGMGTSEGPGHNSEYDYQHINIIMTDLTGYGYTSYTNHQSGGTAAALSSLINSGAGVLVYCGHGYDTGWSCGWTFSNTEVAALTNTAKLPFIFNVSCVTGNFKNITCFSEAWMRATYNNQPSGAMAICGSTINQDWIPPMDAEDEMVDLMVSKAKRTFGGIFVNGMFKMQDIDGTSGQNMADTWVCFGDPSLQVRTPGTPTGPTSSTNNPPVANFTSNKTTVLTGGTVTFTDTSSNTPTSWSWTFNGGTPSTSASQNPTITYSTVGTYSVTLTATNAYGNNTITKTGYITVTDTIPLTYCASASTNTADEWIAGVVVGNLNKTSGASYYSDFTASTANLTKGSSTSLTLTPGYSGTAYAEYWTIWIDYNQNGVFTDTGEAVYSGSGTTAKTGSFTVSTTALTGNTRMRVSMKYNAAPTSCETFTYGEVEDYTANIATGTGAAPVANFTSDKTTVAIGGTVAFTDTSTNTPTSWSWTFTGGTPSTSTAQNPTVTYSTTGTYAVALTATNSYGSNTNTKTGYITVTSASYCTAASTNTNDEWIARVRIGTIDKSSTKSYYSDFTATSTNLTRGASVTVTLNPGYTGTVYSEAWRLFIDYNKDYDFADTGETVFSKTGTSQQSGSFTVLSTASTGATRLRVTMKYSTYTTACGSFNYGEVEDYTVNIL